MHVAADAPRPCHAAGDMLLRFGAAPGAARGTAGLRLRRPDGSLVEAGLEGWNGAPALAVDASGDVLAAYAALRLVGAAVGPGQHVRLATPALVAELLAALRLGGPQRGELLRCRDGWLVVRLRDSAERALLEALAGGPPEACDSAELVAEARLARLLVAPVLPPPAHAAPDPGDGALHGGWRRAARPRVIDWTVLWAGPWAAQQLRRDGLDVERIEHPRRRDGLLGWPSGRRFWRELNAGKRLALLDAREPGARRRLERTLQRADLLLTSMTPRALHGLGFDDDWRRAHAPRLLHLELVAFDEPWADAPGLGEQAAAQAGLLWRDGAEPAAPYPWADPLLGALAYALARVWLAAERPPGGRIRLSLETAASIAFADRLSPASSSRR